MEPIVFMPGRTAPVTGLFLAAFGISLGVWAMVLDLQTSSWVFGGVCIAGALVVLVRSVWALVSDTPQLVVTGTGFHVRGAMPVEWSEVADMDQGSVKLNRGLKAQVIRVWLYDPQAYIDRAVPSVARRAAANLADGNPPIMISPPDRSGNRQASAMYAEVIAALRAGYEFSQLEADRQST